MTVSDKSLLAPRSSTSPPTRLGAKVRAFRRAQKLTQAALAARLAISPSYLNLIESNRRALPAPLLIKLAQTLGIDLTSFATDDDARLVSDLTEVFSDPLFDEQGVTQNDVRELAMASPVAAKGVLTLYRAFRATRATTDSLVTRITDDDDRGGVELSLLPSEEVSDFIQARRNYFPDLEALAEPLGRDQGPNDVYSAIVRLLAKELDVTVRVVRASAERGTLRRYNPETRIVSLSELLPTRSRTFQLAHQYVLLAHDALLDGLVRDPILTGDASRKLARIALANYFAGAVLMPYGEFCTAAKEERYDIDVLGRRFRVGFEQVCHRLTTLRRPGAEGVPFHMIRIDVAGNISKRFSASGIRFARFSGACSRWNIFAAFQTPGMIRVQLSRMTEGDSYFCIARTVQRDSGGYHSQQPVLAIGLGCAASYAHELVYSDGVSIDEPRLQVPVGVTCRLCERTDCEQRALPSMKVPFAIDEDRRGATLYVVPSGQPSERVTR